MFHSIPRNGDVLYYLQLLFIVLRFCNSTVLNVYYRSTLFLFIPNDYYFALLVINIAYLLPSCLKLNLYRFRFAL